MFVHGTGDEPHRAQGAKEAHRQQDEHDSKHDAVHHRLHTRYLHSGRLLLHPHFRFVTSVNLKGQGSGSQRWHSCIIYTGRCPSRGRVVWVWRKNNPSSLSPRTACGATKFSITSTTTTTTTTTTNNNNSSSSDNNSQTPDPPHPVETALSTSVVHCTWTSRVQDCRPQEFRRYTVPCTSGMQSHSRHWVHVPPHPQPKRCSSACILEGGFDLPTQ